MSIKVDLSAEAVDQQIALLKEYPEIADRHYRPVLQKDVQLLAAMVQPGIPNRTGRSIASFGSRVIGKGTSITGELGWYKKNAPFYIKFIEGGAKPHEIAPRGAKVSFTRMLAGTGGAAVLRFPGTSQGGDFVFIHGSVHNPGVRGRGFMQAAWDAAGPLVENDIAAANDAVLKDLSI
jgi:hypothetical protein